MPKKNINAQSLLDDVAGEEDERKSAQELVDSVEDSQKPKKVIKIVESSVTNPETAKLRAEINKLEAQEKAEKTSQSQMSEKRRLQKRIKQMKFQKTALGKISKVVGKGVDVITKPEIKDKKTGRIIQKGGLGSSIMHSVGGLGEQLTRPKGSPTPRQAVEQKIMRKARVHQGVSAGEPNINIQAPKKSPQASFSQMMSKIGDIAGTGGMGSLPQRTEKNTAMKLNDILNFGNAPVKRMPTKTKKGKIKAKMQKKRMQPKKPQNINDFINSLPQ